jgi:hypothetical protein
MAFLEIFECYNSPPPKTPTLALKTSEFLYAAIEALMGLVFRGIRVRSYHLYKFIRIYLKLTKEKESSLFFNSVIAYYIDKLIREILKEFRLPEAIRSFCDDNMNGSHCRSTKNVKGGPIAE